MTGLACNLLNLHPHLNITFLIQTASVKNVLSVVREFRLDRATSRRFHLTGLDHDMLPPVFGTIDKVDDQPAEWLGKYLLERGNNGHLSQPTLLVADVSFYFPYSRK